MRLAAYAGVGLAAGTALGLILKAVQSLSGHRVYRLLLNADYVPVLKNFRLSEWTEFVIHLIISVVLCVVLGLLWERRAKRSLPSAGRMTGITALIGGAIGLLLYPTTLLSRGGTPPIDSLPAWLWWLGVHLLYGAAVGLLLYAVLRAKNSDALPRR
ncbi:hypothetical protein GYN08_07480 [Saccharibacillus sp. VR-M41]|uniref:Uncharacterized protein n=2 Tax=Saccharibacillus alkalitolerans TaxID=2705290 RepID=A0ABX0F3U0_9BACL|nr:hypothetical protein [Saccharibacillus alkalitolerans]